MRTTEGVLGILAVIGVAVKLANYPGGGLLTIFSLLFLALLYMFLGFALFNDIPLRAVFKKESYEHTNTLRVVGTVLLGLTLATATMGIMFWIQAYPGRTVLLIFGLSGLLTALIVGVVRYINKRSPFYVRIFKRIAVFGALSFYFIIFPRDVWTEYEYRDHPEYLKALQEAEANPDNQALWDRLREEEEKIREEEE